jgi:hypothetical protein
MPSLSTTLGGTTAAVCSRCQSQRNYEFAMHRCERAPLRWLRWLREIGRKTRA